MKKIELKKATMADVGQIFALIKYYADEQLMLPRPLGVLYETIRDFVIAQENGEIVGVGALHVVWQNLGEIRSLAVKRESCGRGIGRMMVEFLKEEARSLKISELFALTYQPGFFQKCGFQLVTKDVFPAKVWTDCINCIKFPNCDEVAVKITL